MKQERSEQTTQNWMKCRANRIEESSQASLMPEFTTDDFFFLRQSHAAHIQLANNTAARACVMSCYDDARNQRKIY